MKKDFLIKLFLVSFALIAANVSAQDSYQVPISANTEPIAAGPYKPNWTSLKQYKHAPDWFRNAKFGIWAHWGPQCEPENGDWYAREMYFQGSNDYRFQVEHFGHPSQVGFKDVIHQWKAENWDPDKLVALYKRCGAKYFFALANHHDNFDLWDSKYQEWNSVNMGPKKDLIAGWAAACKKEGLPFGVSVHASHAWTWYEGSQQSDKTGPLAGVPYDGKLTKADGKGKWWEGYNPQELYAQNHPLSQGAENKNKIHSQWDWGDSASIPSTAYCDKFYNRTIDLINRYNPDLIYFDDTTLPLYPISDAGLKIAAHFYNKSIAEHNGKNEAVLFGKILTKEQQQCITWDVERGAPDHIEEIPWQTCTCIGNWHYDRWLYYNNGYKSPTSVIQMLCDVVSKNGNLLLSIPVRADGTIDPTEEKIVNEIGKWLDINGEAIYGTRPWVKYGEGPSADKSNPMNAQGFNEGKVKMGASDIRFTKNGKNLYVIVLGIPTKELTVTSLGKTAKLTGKIKKISMLGSIEKIIWKQDKEALRLSVPAQTPRPEAIVYKVSL